MNFYNQMFFIIKLKNKLKLINDFEEQKRQCRKKDFIKNNNKSKIGN